MTDPNFHRRRIRNERASRSLDVANDIGCFLLVLMFAAILLGPVVYRWWTS